MAEAGVPTMAAQAVLGYPSGAMTAHDTDVLETQLVRAAEARQAFFAATGS